MNPTMSLARRELKNEPWPQSWKMMNRRTRNAPARIAGGIVSQSDTSNARAMTYQRRKYGISVLASCHSARLVEECWYRATTSLQAA